MVCAFMTVRCTVAWPSHIFLPEQVVHAKAAGTASLGWVAAHSVHAGVSAAAAQASTKGCDRGAVMDEVTWQTGHETALSCF